MFLKLRIFFTVLSALCLVAILPAAVWGGPFWFAVCGCAALLFFGLMLLCKQSQEKQEREKNPPEPQADYLHPKNERDNGQN